jgi:hypothetical protein
MQRWSYFHHKTTPPKKKKKNYIGHMTTIQFSRSNILPKLKFLNSITDSFLIVAASDLHVKTVEKGTIVLYTKHLSVVIIILLPILPQYMNFFT